MKISVTCRKLLPAFLLVSALALSGCADLFSGFSSSGASSDSGYSTAAPARPEYYYSSFADVPIPVEMKSTKDSYSVYTSGNIKVGMETFTGRVEINSLNQAMRDYMTRDGWGLYSGSQGSKQTALVFVKDNLLAVVITTDGSMSTEMRVYMTQKI
jgi:hypothetical protein